jgi:hypothetical protein
VGVVRVTLRHKLRSSGNRLVVDICPAHVALARANGGALIAVAVTTAVDSDPAA